MKGDKGTYESVPNSPPSSLNPSQQKNGGPTSAGPCATWDDGFLRWRVKGSFTTHSKRRLWCRLTSLGRSASSAATRWGATSRATWLLGDRFDRVATRVEDGEVETMRNEMGCKRWSTCHRRQRRHVVENGRFRG